MARVFQGQRTFLHPLLRPVERLIYRLAGVREDTEQRWTQYAASVIAFSVASFLFVYVIQRLQGILPFNPMHFGTKAATSGATPVTPDLAFNTAVSFLTNTNWQAYSGEMTFSYFVQMAALAVQNFVSAAVGISVAIALIRGFARQETKTIGNFWVDLTRSTVYVLLPIAFVRRVDPLLAGRHPELSSLCRRQDCGRSDSDNSAGSGCLSRSHQDAGNQWRGILQRQLRAPL